jgi:hypothetical protein
VPQRGRRSRRWPGWCLALGGGPAGHPGLRVRRRADPHARRDRRVRRRIHACPNPCVRSNSNTKFARDARVGHLHAVLVKAMPASPWGSERAWATASRSRCTCWRCEPTPTRARSWSARRGARVRWRRGGRPQLAAGPADARPGGVSAAPPPRPGGRCIRGGVTRSGQHAAAGFAARNAPSRPVSPRCLPARASARWRADRASAQDSRSNRLSLSA